MADGDLAYSHVPSDGGSLLFTSAPGHYLLFCRQRYYWTGRISVEVSLVEESPGGDAAGATAELVRQAESAGWNVWGVSGTGFGASKEVGWRGVVTNVSTSPFDFLRGDVFMGYDGAALMTRASRDSFYVKTSVIPLNCNDPILVVTPRTISGIGYRDLWDNLYKYSAHLSVRRDPHRRACPHFPT